MTKHKAEKRAVRERMAKTGERYTTARHYLFNLHRTGATNDAVPPADGAADVSTLAPAPAPAGTSGWVAAPGMSDDALQRNTGKRWDEWFAILDAWGGAERTHAEIAKYLNETHNPGGWWAQGITVGYERARGLRKKHQQADGFAVSASKTVAVPVERLYEALVDETRRDQWLEPGTLRLRTSQPGRSARFDVAATGTLLAVTFVAKDESKASIQLQESKLPTEEDVESRRVFWKASLNDLAAVLTSAP